MKKALKSLVLWARGLPFIGRLVGLAVAVYRLPLVYGQLASLDARLAHLEVRLGVPGHGTDTRPSNEDIQNLVLSTPVALRKLRRDVDLLLRDYQVEPSDSHTAIPKAGNE